MKLSYIEEIPTVQEYLSLRQSVLLSSKSEKGSSIGLNNSFYCVCVRNDVNELVAMGRVIGDGGTAFQIVDVLTMPSYQKNGIGSHVLHLIMTYIEAVDDKAYVSLIASQEGKDLYEKFGFVDVAPSVGMKWVR